MSKNCENVWNKTIEKVCQEQGIFGDKVMFVDELVDVGLFRILMAEGVDIKDIISGCNLSNQDKISQVFSKVLGKAVEPTANDKLISSATWLFLEYFRKFQEKKAILWGQHAEASSQPSSVLDVNFQEATNKAIFSTNVTNSSMPSQQIISSINSNKVSSAGVNNKHEPRRFITEANIPHSNIFLPARKFRPCPALQSGTKPSTNHATTNTTITTNTTNTTNTTSTSTNNFNTTTTNTNITTTTSTKTTNGNASSGNGQENSSMPVVPQQHDPEVIATNSKDDFLDEAIKTYKLVDITEYFKCIEKLPGVTIAHEVLKVHCYVAKHGNCSWKDAWGKIFKNLKAEGYFDGIKTPKTAINGKRPGMAALCWFLFGDMGSEVWEMNQTRKALGVMVKPHLDAFGVDFDDIDRLLPLIVFLIITHNISKTKTDETYLEFIKSPPKNFKLLKISNSSKYGKRKRARTTTATNENSQHNESMSVVDATSPEDPVLAEAIKSFKTVNINEYIVSDEVLPGVTTAHEVFKVHCFKAKSNKGVSWRDVWGAIFKSLKAEGYFSGIDIHEGAEDGKKPGLSALCWFLFGRKGPKIWGMNPKLEQLAPILEPKLKVYGVNVYDFDRLFPLIAFLLVNHNIEKAKTDTTYQDFLKSPPNSCFALLKIINCYGKGKKHLPADELEVNEEDDFSESFMQQSDKDRIEWLGHEISYLSGSPLSSTPAQVAQQGHMLNNISGNQQSASVKEEILLQQQTYEKIAGTNEHISLKLPSEDHGNAPLSSSSVQVTQNEITTGSYDDFVIRLVQQYITSGQFQIPNRTAQAHTGEIPTANPTQPKLIMIDTNVSNTPSALLSNNNSASGNTLNSVENKPEGLKLKRERNNDDEASSISQPKKKSKPNTKLSNDPSSFESGPLANPDANVPPAEKPHYNYLFYY